MNTLFAMQMNRCAHTRQHTVRESSWNAVVPIGDFFEKNRLDVDKIVAPMQSLVRLFIFLC